MIDIIGTHPNLTRSGQSKTQEPLTVAYVRVSTEKQELSTKAQVKVIRDYAHWNRLTIYRFYAEKKSAKSLRGRPELQRILDMADAGMVANVVVQDITRLFRSVREALIDFDRLEAKGVRFHSAVEPLDASIPDGELMRTFKLALGQHERRRLGERTARVLRATKLAKAGTGLPGVESKARRGKLLVGRAPYGFKWNRQKKTLVEHPWEFPILKEILQRHRQGQSVRGILDWLNEARIPTKRKAWRWERMQVWRIVQAHPT